MLVEKNDGILELTGTNMTVHRVQDDHRPQALGSRSFVC